MFRFVPFSDVPQESLLGTLLFNTFINGIRNIIKYSTNLLIRR
jgi:hypothetical protein